MCPWNRKAYTLVAAFCPYSLLLLALFSNRFWILAPAHTKSSRMCRGILGDEMQTKMQSHWRTVFNIYFCKCQEADAKKRSKEDEQTLEELNSAHRCPYKPVTSNELNCSCFCHIINILLTELSRSVWENLDLGRVYRPHCFRSVLTDLGQDCPIQTFCPINKS